MLDPEDQKVVNRWRLVVIGFYATVAVITITVAAFNSAKNGETVEAQLRSTKPALPANVKP